MLSSIFQKVFGSRVRVESTAKIAELELAEKVCFLFNLKVWIFLTNLVVQSLWLISVPPCVKFLHFDLFSFYILLKTNQSYLYIPFTAKDERKSGHDS